MLAATLAFAAPIQPPQSGEPNAEADADTVAYSDALPPDAVDLTDKVEVTVKGQLRSTSGTAHSIAFSIKNISDDDLQGPLIVLVDETGIDALELTKTDGQLSDDRPYVEIVGKNGELKAGKTLRPKKLVFKTEQALTLDQRNAFEPQIRVCRFDEDAALAAADDDADKIEGKSYGWKEFDKVAAIQENWTVRLITNGQGQVYGTGVSEDDNGDLVVTVFTERPNTDDIVPDTIDGIPVKIHPVGQMFRAGPARNDVIYPNGRARKANRGNEEDFEPVPEAEQSEETSGTSLPLPLNLDPTLRFNRPVPIGVSIANADQLFFNPDLLNCYSGTLGCRCVDSMGTQYILTNLHVGGALMAPFDQPLVMTGIVGDRIVQPSTGDMLNACTIDPANVIGVLTDFENVIIPEDELEQFFFQHLMDASVITADAGAVDSGPPADGYPVLSRDIVHRPYIGMDVQKYGRTTVYTNGKVTSLNLAVLINGYGPAGSLPSYFVRQIGIANLRGRHLFSTSGDSGSLIVQSSPGTPEDGRPLALLFAGGGGLTFANPLGPVLTRFGLQVDDGSGAPFQAGQSGTMGGAIGPGTDPPIIIVPDDGGGGD